jgi:hypothetical protein
VAVGDGTGVDAGTSAGGLAAGGAVVCGSAAGVGAPAVPHATIRAARTTVAAASNRIGMVEQVMANRRSYGCGALDFYIVLRSPG